MEFNRGKKIMQKKKLTEEEIAENRKRLEDAIGFAKLDNNADISKETQELFELMVRGELTPDEVREKIIKKHMKGTI